MIRTSLITAAGLCVLLSLGGCGKDNLRDYCDEAQPYQSLQHGKRIVVPEGLDPLDDFREIPIPRAETAPRPEGAGCIESPPAVGSGS